MNTKLFQMSSFQQRLPIMHKEHGIAELTMAIFLKDAAVDNIWNDTSQDWSEFADKYFGKTFMQELKETAREGHHYVNKLIKRFLNLYSNVHQIIDDSKHLAIHDFVEEVMKIGKNVGFKHALVCKLFDSIIPKPGTSTVHDCLVPIKLFDELFKFLPNEWSQMRKEFFSFSNGSYFYERLICRLLWITIHCIVDSVRLISHFSVDKRKIFKTSKIALAKPANLDDESIQIQTIPSDKDEYLRRHVLRKESSFCRSVGVTLINILFQHRKPNHSIIFHPKQSLDQLPMNFCHFLEDYISTVSQRLKTFIKSGEFRYNAEKLLQIQHVPLTFSALTPENTFHLKLGDFMNFVADRILNTEEFPLFGETWKPIIRRLTKTMSPIVFSPAEFWEMFESFDQTCRRKLLDLLRDHPNANAFEFHTRARLTRFVFWFCASVVRFSMTVHLRTDSTISSVRYDGKFERRIVDEEVWKPSEMVKNVVVEQRSMENVEVTDEELEAARSLRAPSTSSGHNSALINPEFIEFYRRVENDEKLSDEWKEMVRTMLFSNYQLLKEYERVEERFRHVSSL